MIERIRRWLRRDRVRAEIDEELAFHLEERERLLREAGRSSDEARREARVRFGSRASALEAAGEAWRPRWAEEFSQDLRLAARSLAKTPGFTVSALLALTLGIGAATTVFSLLHAVVLRPLPFAAPDRLFTVRQENPKTVYGFRSGASREQVRALEDARTVRRAVRYWSEHRFLTGAAEPEALFGAPVAPEFFDALGVEARWGRTFTSDDYESDGRVVVLSDRLWRRQFGGDPTIVGSEIRLDDAAYTVVGVLAPNVRYPVYQSQIPGISNEFWSPLRGDPRWTDVLLELAPGVTREQAESEVAELLRQDQPAWTTTLRPVDLFVEEVRRPLQLAFAAVGLVLLIACANVCGLLLARGTSREREAAVRAALGAGRLRLARQELTQSLLLAAVGCAAGVGLAAYATRELVRLFPHRIPRAEEASIDWTTAAFAVAAALLAALVAGAVPAWRASRRALHGALSGGGRAGTDRAGRRWLDWIVAGETALTVVLLVGAGLLIRSVDGLLAVDTGFAGERVLTMRLSLPGHRYGEWSRTEAFHADVLQAMETLPGAESASLSYLLPMSGRSTRARIEPEGRSADAEPFQAETNVVTPGFFQTLGLRLARGRAFDARDDAQSDGTVIISRSAAEAWWPGEDPVGKRVRFVRRGGSGDWRTVVGVTNDVKHWGVKENPMAKIYLPYSQPENEFTRRMLTLLTFVSVRTAGPPEALAAAARERIWALDPDQPVSQVVSLETTVERSLSAERLERLLLTALAATGLLLSALGLYGVLAFAVGRRTREIGVRRALGARAGDVVLDAAGRGLRVAGVGLAVGLVGAAGLTRVLELDLYEVTPLDPATYVVAVAVLVSAAGAAGVVPARRAARVHPAEALRHE